MDTPKLKALGAGNYQLGTIKIERSRSGSKWQWTVSGTGQDDKPIDTETLDKCKAAKEYARRAWSMSRPVADPEPPKQTEQLKEVPQHESTDCIEEWITGYAIDRRSPMWFEVTGMVHGVITPLASYKLSPWKTNGKESWSIAASTTAAEMLMTGKISGDPDAPRVDPDIELAIDTHMATTEFDAKTKALEVATKIRERLGRKVITTMGKSLQRESHAIMMAMSPDTIGDGERVTFQFVNNGQYWWQAEILVDDVVADRMGIQKLVDREAWRTAGMADSDSDSHLGSWAEVQLAALHQLRLKVTGSQYPHPVPPRSAANEAPPQDDKAIDAKSLVPCMTCKQLVPLISENYQEGAIMCHACRENVKSQGGLMTWLVRLAISSGDSICVGITSVADMLGVSERTAWRYVKREDFPREIGKYRQGSKGQWVRIWLEWDLQRFKDKLVADKARKLGKTAEVSVLWENVPTSSE